MQDPLLMHMVQAQCYLRLREQHHLVVQAMGAVDSTHNRSCLYEEPPDDILRKGSLSLVYQ